jgi:hypothetical protein
MPLLGKGTLVIWHGITAEGEADMLRWHDVEHIPERVGVPGFLRGRRYAHATRPREYLDLYETESVETIRSAPYLDRLNHPTAWTQRVLPHFRDTFRIGCRVLASTGRGQGGALVTVRVRPAEGKGEALRGWLADRAGTALRETAGVVAVHAVETVPETTQIKTAEGKLKGGEVATAEAPWPLVLLIDCDTVEAAQSLAGGPLHPDRLVGHGAAPGALVGAYRLHITMDRA